jgi:Tol biopolymer transport system component
MFRKTFAGLIIAVLLFSALSMTLAVRAGSLSQSPQPPRPPSGLHRDRDTGASTLGRAPVSAGQGSALVASESVSPLQTTGMAAWSKLTYQSYIGNWDVFVANGDGSNPVRLTSAGAPDITPRLNRGATRIAYASSEPGNYEIYTTGLDGRNRVRLTTQAANDYSPAWSPDGTRLVFNSYRDSQSEIYVMNADGSNLVRLTYHAAYDGQPVWSPDGTRIAFLSDRSGSSQIWVMNADGSGATQLTTQAYSEDPAWSPDGTQIAYDADADGDGWQELMVINANGTNPHVIGDTGTTADMWARSWSPDGRSVAFTLISYINYQGNWYWTAAYSLAADAQTGGLYSLGGSDVDWFPDWQTTDLLPPTSSMTALPTTSPSPFSVQWSGADAGPSGILGYDVQVKDGVGGAWTIWLNQTSSTSANYSGIGGHTYFFRVRAVDNSSNAQVWPASAQISTTVESLAPTTAVTALPAQSPAQFVVKWSGSDPGGSGILNYDIQCKSDTDLDWQDWQANVTVTSTVYTGLGGHTYYFRARARDRAGNLEAWPIDPDALTTVENLAPVSSIKSLPDYARGTLTIRWQGYDLGGSGINTYDVQYSDAVDNLWHDWQAGTAATQGDFAGTTGHTYAFRVRAIDLAQNQADWSLVNADTSVTFYTWQLMGQVLDTRSVPVPYASLSISPTLLNATSSGSGGRYLGYSAEGGMYTVQPTHAGYDTGHIMSVTLTSDVAANHVLPPLDNQILNGDFEEPIDFLSGWNWGGIISPTQGLPHTGQSSLNLYADTRPQLTKSDTAGDGSIRAVDLAIDASNNLHLVYVRNLDIFYARRTSSGMWLTPTLIASGGSQASLAVGTDGTVHVVWKIGSIYSQSELYYTYLPPGGTWSEPIVITWGYRWGYSPELAIDSKGGLHLVYHGLYALPYDWLEMVYYQYRPPNGNWQLPESLIPTNFNTPRISIGPDDKVQVVVDDSGGSYGGWGYYCTRSNAGVWTCNPTSVVSTNSCMTVDHSGTMHWLTRNLLDNKTYYLSKPAGSSIRISEVPVTFDQNCNLATDNTGRLYAAIMQAGRPSIWLKPANGQWYDPTEIDSEASTNPDLRLDSQENIHLVYGTNTSGVTYQVSLLHANVASVNAFQAVSVPVTLVRPTLSFLYQLTGVTQSNPAGLRVTVADGVSSPEDFNFQMNTPTWAQGWVDMSRWAGRSVTVSFATAVDGFFKYTNATLDEVSLGSWLTPVPQAVIPNRLDVMSSSVVTITGDNFVPETQVWFNGIPSLDVHLINAKVLTAVVPALAQGRYDLVVANPDGRTGALPDALLIGHEVSLPLVMK